MLRCLFVALYNVYVVFGGPHNLPQIPNSFPAWQQMSFLAAKSCCENAAFLTFFAAIEIARKLLGIWGWLWGPGREVVKKQILAARKGTEGAEMCVVKTITKPVSRLICFCHSSVQKKSVHNLSYNNNITKALFSGAEECLQNRTGCWAWRQQ